MNNKVKTWFTLCSQIRNSTSRGKYYKTRHKMIDYIHNQDVDFLTKHAKIETLKN